MSAVSIGSSAGLVVQRYGIDVPILFERESRSQMTVVATDGDETDEYRRLIRPVRPNTIGRTEIHVYIQSWIESDLQGTRRRDEPSRC